MDPENCMYSIDDTYSCEFRPMDQFETEVTGLHPGTDYQIRNAVSLSWHTVVPLIQNQLGSLSSKKICSNFIF
jgi:hypothetical protein